MLQGAGSVILSWPCDIYQTSWCSATLRTWLYPNTRKAKPSRFEIINALLAVITWISSSRPYSVPNTGRVTPRALSRLVARPRQQTGIAGCPARTTRRLPSSTRILPSVSGVLLLKQRAGTRNGGRGGGCHTLSAHGALPFSTLLLDPLDDTML